MFKQIVFLLVLSLLIVIGTAYAHQAMQYLVNAHEWIDGMLTEVFSGGTAGNIIRQLIALLAIPVFVGLVPAIIFWMVKRRWMPYFMEIVWVIWLLQTGALVILYKAPVMGI